LAVSVDYVARETASNLWRNRLIGDRQPSATKKYTFITFQHYTADTPILDSGLLGPVKLFAVTKT